MDIIITGVGVAAENLQMPHFRNMANCNIVALCDPHVECTRQVASRVGIAEV